MAEQVAFRLANRNPDVLSCIANLSNDEVFTPPALAKQMLDLLARAWAESHDGADIWADSRVRFLDPFTKSGVFLREITSRLTSGLAAEIPDLQSRVDHILTHQVFGIAITRLTSLIARRSVYCSKWANGPHSIARSLPTEAGNIWFEPMTHDWRGATEFVETADDTGQPIRHGVNGRCRYCGATQRSLDRGSDLESHAYAFIHTNDIKARIAELFGAEMQFDVIVGNPPYHLTDGGGGAGSSASPIYQKFVAQAKALDPRILAMVIPSRWFTGGKGLDEFRESMLADGQIRQLIDYPISVDVFPQNGPKGGVCVFLWDRDSPGVCHVTTQFRGDSWSSTRPLLEPGTDVFIRYSEGLSVLQKVAAVDGSSATLALPENRRFHRLVSVRRPFGFTSTFKGHSFRADGDLPILQKGGAGYVHRDEVTSGQTLIDAWKVFVGFAAPGTGDKDTYPHRIISTPFIGRPGTVSTETYLAIGPFGSHAHAVSVLSYLSCRLTRFLILLHKPSQNTTRAVYSFVPTQTWDRPWTDEALYAKYGITAEEQSFIESMVRPMELSEDSVDLRSESDE